MQRLKINARFDDGIWWRQKSPCPLWALISRLKNFIVWIEACYIVKLMKAKGGLLAISAMLLIAALLGGCGGGGSSDSTASSSSGTEASAQFLKVTGPNELVEFGTEASGSEREAATALLEKSFKARAAANFAAQCATLSKVAVEQVKATAHVDPNGNAPKGCAGKLEELASPLGKSKEAREDRLGEPIPAMRVKGKKAFALFHGTEGKAWVIPLEQEDGEWRVAALQEEELQPESASKSSGTSKKSTPQKTAE
jgi:hypothetical protein